VPGLNLENMPELRWVLGQPFTLVLLALVSVTDCPVVTRRDWI